VITPVTTINGSKTRSARRCIGESVFSKYILVTAFVALSFRWARAAFIEPSQSPVKDAFATARLLVFVTAGKRGN
jgi:hypothetical protein